MEEEEESWEEGGGRWKRREMEEAGGAPKDCPAHIQPRPRWSLELGFIYLPSNWATGWEEPSAKVPHPPLLKNGCHLGPARCRSQSTRLKFLGDRTGPAALLRSCDLQCHWRRDRSRTGHPPLPSESPGKSVSQDHRDQTCSLVQRKLGDARGTVEPGTEPGVTL